MLEFTHLHVHSQYSILDGAASIDALIEKAIQCNMKAIALTDHGSMLGVKEFHEKCTRKKIKPIIGCEAYVARRNHTLKKESIDKLGWHLIILAKNITGYHNLIKLISKANIDGFYYKARIDKEMLKEHSEGLIVCSACLGGEIPALLLGDKAKDVDDDEGSDNLYTSQINIPEENITKAEESILWYKEIFGDDYYLEIMYHPNEEEKTIGIPRRQKIVNEKILELGEKHNIKVIATNDVHFVNEEDAEAHDVLICLTTNTPKDSPKRMRYTRQEWFKTADEMNQLFGDNPETLRNTMEIANKIEEFKIDSKPIMPEFFIPEEFGKIEDYCQKYSEEMLIEEFGKKRYKDIGGYESVVRIKYESDYLAHLVDIGSKERYGENIPLNIKKRIDFELKTIKTMGFPGYFLIVQDFIAAARKMGVLIGKGRGSAAGSVVAYCTKITDVDPIEFDLLFERFLNPDRISMPDMDIDFDDDGRSLVINYVTEKYGKEKVAHICTIGTMKAKGALKDVARILQIPLSDVNALTKKINDKGSLNNAYNLIIEAEKKFGTLQNVIADIDTQMRKAKEDETIANLENRKVLAEEITTARANNDFAIIKTIQIACTLEGSVRQTGVHACGMLIGKNNLENNIPLMRTKDDADIATTQYEGSYVESIGLLKMDFLGLRTLSIIKESLSNIKISKGIDIDIEQIPLNDEKTLELFKNGSTTSIFQFESDGMRSNLKQLKPNHFNDLVAMNALYRPGPMDYIPKYIARKHKLQKIEYDHPLCEQFLKDTYGITVYQEQVMLQSRALANFTRGESDTLRKAMGKKKIEEMAKLKTKFINGCLENPKFIDGCNQINKEPNALITKIWGDWESFAEYAFNKSHSVCYAYIAYQTAYLKAHYPAEFMAANMTRSMSSIERIEVQMSECSKMGIKVLSPDINESYKSFTVNKDGNIRFGLGGIKNVGTVAVEDIIIERETNGIYKDIFDFVSRVNLTAVNKKSIEALAYSGAFDCFNDYKRPQYFAANQDGSTFVENLIKFGNKIQEPSSGMSSVFGDAIEIEIKKPEAPPIEEYDILNFLHNEKELIGMYLSGHPLDNFKFILDYIKTTPLKSMENEEISANLENVRLVGFITSKIEKMSKDGKPFAEITMIDYSGTYSFTVYTNEYIKFKNFLDKNYSIIINASFIKYKDNEKNTGKRYFKISNIDLLSNIQKDYFREIILTISYNNINKYLINEIKSIIKNNEGNATLKINIYKPEENTLISLISRLQNIQINEDMFSQLENNTLIEKVELKHKIV